MKLVGSWKSKYIGFTYKGYVYYMFWQHREHRRFGYFEEWYDGPIQTFGLWFIGFQRLWDFWAIRG
jgi:hypothetical protein